jgi:tetratricopeptide (TPR) repeat protein/tRNA A-37 threonylcarbamoyl transferase component Bud32
MWISESTMAINHEKAKAIFLAALERDGGERAALLVEACAGDAELRQRVDRLLQAHDRPDSVPATPAAEPTVDSAPPEGDEHAAGADSSGTVVGSYKLVKQIGEGGMGAVYLAQQTEPVKRLVAVKLIKPGMDSRQVIARFEAERQALALMEHPNIAKVLEAGATAQGRPYFVMELVKGVPITRYCDECRLTPRQRLELFVPVCQAVQHAHQKGIIHRDLKPSNVLVASYDDRPVPKVIDFGIAKAAGPALTEKTLVTDFGNIVGTLEYMSPEQAELNQLDFDTRSDVYSLGVVLYELLTGSTPLEKKRLKEAAVLEALRLIREEEPPRPSARLSTTEELPSVAANRGLEPKKLSSLVRGELDWIVMKALDKDRDRRYETANGLARDLECYLHDEPVQAGPPSARYRIWKFVRRNRRVLATAAVLGVMLVVALGAVAGSLVWASRDRAVRLAETESAATAALEEAVTLQRQKKWPEALEAARRAQGLLTEGSSDELRRRVRDLLKDVHMVLALEEVRLLPIERTVSDRDFVVNRPRTPDAAYDYAAADTAYVRTFQEYGIDVESLSPAEGAARVRASAIWFELAVALDHWASVRQIHSQNSKQRGTPWKPLIAVARAADPDEWRNQVRDAFAQREVLALHKLAASPRISELPLPTLSLLGSALRAMSGDQQAVQVLREAQQEYPDDFHVNVQLAWALDSAASPLPDDAIRFYTVARALRPRNVSVLRALAELLSRQGKRAEAMAAYRKITEVQPDNVIAHRGIAGLLRREGKEDEAIAVYRKLIERNPKSTLDHSSLGNCLERQRKWEEASAETRKAIDLDPKDYVSYWQLGRILDGQGKRDEAVAALRKAIELNPNYLHLYDTLGMMLARHANYERGFTERQAKWDEAVAVYRKLIELQPKASVYHTRLAGALQGQRNWDEALAEYRKAVELQPNDWNPHFLLGGALKEHGNLDEAITELRKAVELEPKSYGSYGSLGFALEAQGKWDDAAAAFRKAIELKPDYADAYRGLGRTLERQGKGDEAITTYRKAIELEPRVLWYYSEFGGILERQGKVDEALAEFRKAVELSPTSANGYAELGSFLERQGKRDDAIAAFRKAVAAQPDYSGYHALLGEALQGQGQWDEAITEFLKAVELAPDRAVELATALRRQGKHDGAAKILDRAESVLRLALSQTREGQGRESASTAATLARLSVNLLEQKKYAEAEPLLRDCLAIRRKQLPNDWLTSNTCSMLGGALAGQKKYVEAESLLVQGYDGMKQREAKVPAVAKVRLTDALERLVALYEATGDRDKADGWRKKLEEATAVQKKQSP